MIYLLGKKNTEIKVAQAVKVSVISLKILKMQIVRIKKSLKMRIFLIAQRISINREAMDTNKTLIVTVKIA